jgi:hypothetical protein
MRRRLRWRGPGGLVTAGLAALLIFFVGSAVAPAQTPSSALARMPDGKPNLNGIWQVLSAAAFDLEDHNAAKDVHAGRTVIDGNVIPYQPSAAAKKKENYAKRNELDPLNKCFLPGVPRITYLPFPFQIQQTPTYVGITYEYSHAYRMVYLNGTKHPEALSFWMGDSRGRWEGDTLVVDVSDLNDRTWLDGAGNFHSDALHVVERYTPIDKDHINYEATIEDPKVFTRPWKISMPLYRRLEKNVQVMDYECLEFREKFMPWYEVPEGLPKPPGR